MKSRLACSNVALGSLSARSNADTWRPLIQMAATATFFVLALSVGLLPMLTPALGQSPSNEADVHEPLKSVPPNEPDRAPGRSTTEANKQAPAAPNAPDGAPSNTAGPESETQIPPQSTVPGKTTDAELEFWRSVKDSKNPAEIEAYLSAFPNGAFVPLARVRLKRLQEIGETHDKDNAAPAASNGAEVGDTQTTSTPPVHDCDRLAAHPFDPGRKSDGVEFGQLQVEEVVRTCQQALASNPGTARFEYQLGRAFQHKEWYGKALTHFRSAADKTYAAAMSNLGLMYEGGTGVAKDDAEAASWYRKAAEKGAAIGMFCLGVMYEEGRGVARDEAEAVRWYRKVADMGYPPAMNNLGAMYESGRGVAKDESEAARWYRKAADEGHPGAMYNLGISHANGLGVARDETEAVRLFRKSAEMGHANAMHSLGNMYRDGRGVAKDEAEAVRWYRKAADKGLAGAMNILGTMYELGFGVAKDEAEAARWYRKAAEKGNAYAMNNLGTMYEQGLGVAKDRPAAAQLIFDALRLGHGFTVKEMATNANAWSKEFRRELQRLMHDAGVYDGAIDGSFGPGTRRAIEALAKQ